MRLFFALWPGEEVRAGLARWAKELHAVCGGRPTRPENLHLTLAFLGSVAEERLAEVERAASEVEPRGARLEIDRPGFWRHNRIAWAGTSAVPDALAALSRELRGALGRTGVGFDAKEFAVHVTLLRDAHQPREMPPLETIRWEVDGFALVHSETRAGGSRYRVLRSWTARKRY